MAHLLALTLDLMISALMGSGRTVTAMDEPKMHPCKKCPIRRKFARAFDMHFWGEDCPWECAVYKAWIHCAGKDEQDG